MAEVREQVLRIVEQESRILREENRGKRHCLSLRRVGKHAVGPDRIVFTKGG